MTSWRDTASQTVQDDLDKLLNVVLPFAEELLNKSAQFYPFGATMAQDGNVSLTSAATAVGRKAAPAAVLADLVSGAAARSGTLRAVAFVSDVLVAGKDAVHVELEHSRGESIGIVVPYKINRTTRLVRFGELSASSAAAKVWVAGR